MRSASFLWVSLMFSLCSVKKNLKITCVGTGCPPFSRIVAKSWIIFLGSYEKAILQAVVLRYRKSFPDRLSSLSVQSQYLTSTGFSFSDPKKDFKLDTMPWPWPYRFWQSLLHLSTFESPWLLSKWGLDKAQLVNPPLYIFSIAVGKFITLLNVISHGHKF